MTGGRLITQPNAAEAAASANGFRTCCFGWTLREHGRSQNGEEINKGGRAGSRSVSGSFFLPFEDKADVVRGPCLEID